MAQRSHGKSRRIITISLKTVAMLIHICSDTELGQSAAQRMSCHIKLFIRNIIQHHL